MTQEALKLALEAMESVTVECNNFHHPKKDQNHHWAKCPPIARWDKAITAIKEALAQTQEQDSTYKYASSLATAIWQKHYMKESTKWKPLDTTEGVLNQIENMICGLIKEKSAQRKPLRDDEILAIDGMSDKTWVLMFARAIEAAHGIGENT